MAELKDLSEREIEILTLVATGASNKEIAHRLSISANTVKVHLRNIFAKIGAASRTEAAMYAVSQGLVAGAGPAGAGQEDGGVAQPGEEGAPGYEGLSTAVREEPPALPAGRRFSPRLYYTVAILVAIAVLGSFGASIVFSRQTPPAEATSGAAAARPRWQSLSPMLAPRYGMALAVYGNGIYAIGGSGPQSVTGQSERFDPAGNIWVTMPPKPTPVRDAQAAIIGGRIFVPGGCREDGTPVSSFEVFDIRQAGWSPLSALPYPVCGYGLVAFEGKLYLFGGWDGQKYRREALEYDPEADRWQALTPLPQPLAYESAVTAAGKIFVMGGKNDQGPQDGNWNYRPDLDQPGSSPWRRAASLPAPRYAMGVASVADMVYIVGGAGKPGEALPSLVYASQTDTWQSFDLPADPPGEGVGLVSSGPYLFALGGKTSRGVAAEIQAYQVIYTVSMPVIVK